MPGPGNPTPQGVSVSLDAISQVVGSVLIRTVTGWSYLHAGPAGYVLTSQGPGQLPTWAEPAAPPVQAPVIGFMDPPPDAARREIITALWNALVNSGVWPKCDVLYVLAAHHAQAARLNWKSPAIRTLTPVGEPSFTTDRGYTGDGVDAYLDSGVTAPNLGQYAQDSAHLAVYSLSSGAAQAIDAGTEGALATVLVIRQLIDLTYAQMNSNTAPMQHPVTDAKGLFLVNRSGPTAEQVYRNGIPLGTGSAPSVSINGIGNIEWLRGWGGNYSPRLIACGSAGGSLTASEVLSYHTAIASYLTAVGAL